MLQDHRIRENTRRSSARWLTAASLWMCLASIPPRIASAQSIDPLATKSSGVRATEAQDAAFQKKVDALLGKTNRGAPGCAIGIVRGGVVLNERAFGLANIELNVPLTTASVFNLESMSKQFTGMSVILLITQGRLSLEEDVRKYVPELPVYAQTITVADLLHHTSGLKDDSQLLALSGVHLMDLSTPQMALDLVKRQTALNFTPGSEFSYSDTNYFLLGLIVQRVSGESLGKFAEEHIFAPLGMAHTHFREGATEMVPGVASGYRKRSDGWHRGDDGSEVIGDSGVFSTVEDLLKWDRNFYTKVVGGDAGVQMMLRQSTLSDGTRNNYSAGLEIKTYGGLIDVEHAGDGPGFQTFMMRFPAQEFSVVVLCNSRDGDSPRDIAQSIADIYLSNVRTAKAKGPSELTYDGNAYLKFAGLYWDGRTDLLRELLVKNGKLMQRLFPDDAPASLHYISNNRFESGSGVVYELSPDGLGFMRKAAGNASVAYVRISEQDRKSQNLPDFVGSFQSDSIGVSWSFQQVGDQLVLVRRGFADEPLDHVFRDAFLGDLGIFHFQRDAHGEVAAFDLMNYRLGTVSFERTHEVKRPLDAH